LCAQKDIRSTFSFERSIGTLPVACAASTWNITPLSRQISPISASRLDHADLVVHEHHRGHHGVGPQRRLELLDGDQAVFLRRR
jgi:hypothetical protein